LLELGKDPHILGVVFEHFSVGRVQRLVSFLVLRAGVLVHAGPGLRVQGGGEKHADDRQKENFLAMGHAISESFVIVEALAMEFPGSCRRLLFT
jgi:hypothetical protein